MIKIDSYKEQLAILKKQQKKILDQLDSIYQKINALTKEHISECNHPKFKVEPYYQDYDRVRYNVTCLTCGLINAGMTSKMLEDLMIERPESDFFWLDLR